MQRFQKAGERRSRGVIAISRAELSFVALSDPNTYFLLANIWSLLAVSGLGLLTVTKNEKLNYYVLANTSKRSHAHIQCVHNNCM
jgi:hypothetical protein